MSTSCGWTNGSAKPQIPGAAQVGKLRLRMVRQPRLQETPNAADHWMNRYAEGDDAAFSPLHAALERPLRGFLLRLSGDRSMADDLLQETFVRIHRARGSFDARRNVIPWAYAIARNAYVDELRRKRRAPQLSTKVVDGHDSNIDGHALHAEPVAEQEQRGAQMLEILRNAIGELAVSHREAFVLVRFEGFDMAGAAEILGTTESNIKVRVFRAHKHLRKALHAAGF